MNYTDDEAEFEKRQQFAILEHEAEAKKSAMLRQRHYDQKLIEQRVLEARRNEVGLIDMGDVEYPRKRLDALLNTEGADHE